MHKLTLQFDLYDIKSRFALCEVSDQSDDILPCLLLVQEDDTDYMKD